MFHLDGKRALITGAGSGLGEAIATCSPGNAHRSSSLMFRLTPPSTHRVVLDTAQEITIASYLE